MNTFLHSFLAFILLILPIITHATTNITAIYAFGDSILDAGNNNGLPTLVRSNRPPYGRDFPGHVPTGRFSNGRLITDFIVKQLGLKEFLPAYLDHKTTDHDLITGVSFASAGTGYDDLTAKQSKVLSFNKQLAFFKKCLKRVKRTFGTKKASFVVQNAVFIVAGGTNDVVDNFYNSVTRRTFSISGYHDFLLKNLEGYLKRMYNMGGRTFAVAGLSPIGCLPSQVRLESLKPNNHHKHHSLCVKKQNVDSQKYNAKLLALISRLESTLHGSKFVYIDSYTSLMDMITNPTKYGFQNNSESCCETKSSVFAPLCDPIAPTCQDPSKYVFWDAVHPSQAAYFSFAKSSMEAMLQQLSN